MTVLTPYHMRLDGLTVATYAHGLENVDGLDVIAGRRTAGHRVAYAAGQTEEWDLWPDAKMRVFDIWVAPNDADGLVTFTNAERAHQRANIDQLAAILAKRLNPITVELDVPLDASVETRQGQATVLQAIPVTGSTGKRVFRAMLRFPFPYWNVLPQVNAGALSGAGNVLNVGGGATVHDITLTFSNDARITHQETGDYVEVTGSGGTAVTIALRQGATITQSGSPARGLARRNRPWWMKWEPGTVTLDVTGAGTVTVDYYEARE